MKLFLTKSCIFKSTEIWSKPIVQLLKVYVISYQIPKMKIELGVPNFFHVRHHVDL